MSSLDEELLALAGGDSGDEQQPEEVEQEQTPPAKVRSLSPPDASPSPLPTIEKPDQASPPPARRGTAQKKMNKAKGSAKKRAHEFSDDDEGELYESFSMPPKTPSPKKVLGRADRKKLLTKNFSSGAASSPRSLGSVAMDESSAEESEGELVTASRIDDDDEDGPLYPLDGRFEDEADKARIMALPEVEREQVFYQRDADNLRRQQQIQLRQKLKETERLGSKNKRKAGAADLEDDTRRAVRPKNEKARVLDEYKRTRDMAAKTKEATKSRAAQSSRRRSTRSGTDQSSGKDAEGESEAELDHRRKFAAAREVPATLTDINNAQMTRARFAKVCFYPGFEEMVTGTPVRIAASDQVYRMAIVKGLVEGKPYRMVQENGRPFMTDMLLLCTIGKEEQAIEFIRCSMQPITEAEYQHWLRMMESDGLRLPSRSTMVQKSGDYYALRNRVFTDLELNEKIRRQDKLNHLLRKIAPSVSAPRPETQQEALARVNELNRKRNREEIRAAQAAIEKKRIADHKAAIAKRKAEEARKKEEAEKAATEAQEGLAVPKKVHDELFSDISDISRTASPAPGAVKKPARETKNGFPVFIRPKMEDEIIASIIDDKELEGLFDI